MTIEPSRVGIDATNLGFSQTGVGNYISALLLAIRKLKPNVTIFLYSNRALRTSKASNYEPVLHFAAA